MKYIIMCGGEYSQWETPRQLLKINDECIVERTIRLLKENGINDIAISTHDERFEQFGVKILRHENTFIAGKSGYWVDAFPLINEPACYLFGDVMFSSEAIHTIVNTNTDDIQFFASAPPFNKHYIKPWAEPFAMKVVNTRHFKEAIQRTKELQDKRMFYRLPPISWELWQVIKETPLNKIIYDNYCIINDITCDVDTKDDIAKLEKEYEKLWQNT